MKRIVKNPVEPPEFTAWKAQVNEDWMPCWENFQKPEKPIVHRALLQEQGFLCCYCGRRIDDAAAEHSELDAFESHIEHFVPGEKSTDPLSLEYSNLHVSCLKENAKGAPLHCGAAKGSWFDPGLTVSPLQAGVEDRFLYDAEGHIHPVPGDAGAEKTILHLNLEAVPTSKGQQISPLVVLRRMAIDGALFEENSPLPVDEIRLILEMVRKKDSLGRFPGFAQVIESVGRGLV